MPNTREKLIEFLLCATSSEVIFGKRKGTRFVKAWRIADRLIANGVTVRERGRWKPHYETFDEDAAVGISGGNYQTGWQCSVCGRYEPRKEPYCNCGADMRGEEDGT